MHERILNKKHGLSERKWVRKGMQQFALSLHTFSISPTSHRTAAFVLLFSGIAAARSVVICADENVLVVGT
jgi:hypothetical protein